MFRRHKELEAALAEIRDLRTAYADLIESHNRKVEQMHELDKKNAVLLERLDLVSNYMQAPTRSWGSPEEVEDAAHALRNGQIDRAEYEEILAQTGFDNTEITFDAAEYPRLGSR